MDSFSCLQAENVVVWIKTGTGYLSAFRAAQVTLTLQNLRAVHSAYPSHRPPSRPEYLTSKPQPSPLEEVLGSFRALPPLQLSVPHPQSFF